ncbi:hypothetical protein PR048_010658 [Dryococelus australis]|uniref:HTH CENPB-type domain-containing protein n=1 Tax=Dryococelus australis TaxID=614101 RepID=A0ABQ9I4H4_9NEOP|nr:hypothetical protein PR048_010658 [Dryococelus australis]
MDNPVMIDDYFDKLAATTKKLKIQDILKDHIWNVDETGLMYVMKPNKVVAEIGKKFIYSRTYTEHGETMTLFFLDSTDDSHKPKLLLMDSHGAHIMPQVSEFAKENDIYILTFQSHTTHILQPLDVCVYKALKSPRQKELDDYMTEHTQHARPNKQVFHPTYQVPFIKAMSDKNIRNAFRTRGIVPTDRTVIPKEKLVPLLLTERPVPEEVVLSDANPRPMTVETNPSIQTPPPVDNILKLPTAGPRKEHTRGRVRPNPKAKLITENPPTVHQTMNKQCPQKQQKVEVRHAAPGPSGVQHRGKATKKKTNVRVSSARPTVDDNWTCRTRKPIEAIEKRNARQNPARKNESERNVICTSAERKAAGIASPLGSYLSVQSLGKASVRESLPVAQGEKQFHYLMKMNLVPKDFDVERDWYFFSTSHGKGAVYGIGGLTKCALWNRVKQQKRVVECAEDFVAAASSAIQSMIAAIEDVKAGFSIKKGAEKNGVPRNTRSDKINGKTPTGTGPDSCLTKEEEEMLVEWAISVGKPGFPITRKDLQNSAQQHAKELNREFPFKDGRPGRKWCQHFLSRNPGLTLRTPQNLTKNISLPVMLFTDEHSSHLTLHTSKFCDEQGIILAALLPNATHILQPMDVGVFRPLKKEWKKAVHGEYSKCRMNHLDEWSEPCEEDTMVFEDMAEDNALPESFALVTLLGGKRGATKYRYVCIIQEVQEGDLKVLGMRCVDKTKKTFTTKDDDISFVNRSQDEGILPTIEMNATGARVNYIF